MTLATFQQELQTEYEKHVKKFIWDGYQVNKSGRLMLDNVASQLFSTLGENIHIEALVMAMFTPTYWTKTKGNFVPLAYPLPYNLLRSDKYLDLYRKLISNGETYTDIDGAITAVKRSQKILRTLTTEPDNLAIVKFFILNNSISVYYGVACKGFIPFIQRQAIEQPSPQLEELLEELLKLEGKAHAGGWLSTLRDMKVGR